MMADLRDFRYPLQAAVQLREWRIDSLLRDIVQARSGQRALEVRQRELDEACTAQVKAALGAWTTAPDPARREQMLGYLAGLKAQQLTMRTEHAEAVKALGSLQLALQVEQVGLSALQEHRGGELDAFIRAQGQAQDAAADARWLTLSVWRQRVAGGSSA